MLRKALQYQRLCGGVLVLHEEDPALSAGGAMHEGSVSARLGLAGIPSVSESTMVSRDAALAVYEGGRIHFQHLSCAQSVAALERAKSEGARVSAEVSPHHLTLTDESVLTLDSRFKMNPPLRTEADRKRLVQALRSGLIDCVATDHAPHATHEKEVPFEQAAMGTTGLETAFASLYTTLVLGGELELATLVDRMTGGAAVFDLPVPTVALGELANVCVVDLEASFQVGARGYVSRSENCCFHGQTFRGRVLLTVAGGALAFRAPAVTDAAALAAVK
jgi:dihydroorotase